MNFFATLIYKTNSQFKEPFMKKVSLLFTASLLLLPLVSVFPQTPPGPGVLPYVESQSGDTLVIKDYYAMGDSANSLYNAIFADTVNLPKDRVYELMPGGWYPEINTITTTSLQPTTIMGPDNTPLVEQKGTPPPQISGFDISTGAQLPGINAGNDLIVKNLAATPTSPSGGLNWSYFGFGPAHTSITLDNVLMEHTRWTFVNGGDSCSLYVRNSYFVNMSGQPCRRNGGVYDSFNNGDTLWVENCTHVMAQGSVWKLRNNNWQRVVFNHNTFVNMAGSVFMSLGYQSNMSVTNNLFINCGVQPYPGIQSIDPGEQDPDFEPMGLVNVYPDSADVANGTPRRFLCQGNDAYWDPSLSDVVSIENAAKLDGVTNWQSQMIIWNSRTDSIFQHLPPYNTTPYKYCVTDKWLNVMPTFKNTADLFTTQLANLKEFAIKTVDTSSAAGSGGSAVLPDWRVNSNDSTAYVFPDWPIPIDLSYTDASLLTAGMGYPVGDLNWFPSQKAAWLSHRDAEYAAINTALQSGTLATGIQDPGGHAEGFQLQQNYPNPFNPSTDIKFAIPKAGNVSLIVYNILGEEVATLVNGFKPAQSYTVKFDGTGLASGVYFYTLRYNGQSMTKKMLLLK
jgi:hypothetical protein